MAPLRSSADAEYIQSMEAKRDDLSAGVRDAAIRLLSRLVQIDRWIADHQDVHEATYGTSGGAADELGAELAGVSSAVDGLFSTGLIQQTRQEMTAEVERRLDDGNMPPLM